MDIILAVRSASPDVVRCEYFELECREEYFTVVCFVILHASINIFAHFVVNTGCVFVIPYYTAAV
jgi:hypothetical protein